MRVIFAVATMAKDEFRLAALSGIRLRESATADDRVAGLEKPFGSTLSSRRCIGGAMLHYPHQRIRLT